MKIRSSYIAYMLLFCLSSLLTSVFSNTSVFLCSEIQEDIQAMVNYISSRMESGQYAKGRQACEESVRKMGVVLDKLRQFRKTVSGFNRNTVDEATVKVANARFILMSDCSSEKAMELLKDANKNLSDVLSRLYE